MHQYFLRLNHQVFEYSSQTADNSNTARYKCDISKLILNMTQKSKSASNKFRVQMLSSTAIPQKPISPTAGITYTAQVRTLK